MRVRVYKVRASQNLPRSGDKDLHGKQEEKIVHSLLLEETFSRKSKPVTIPQ